MGEPSGLRLLAVRALNALGKPFGLVAVPRTFPNPLSAEAAGRADVFDRIYQANFWSSAESRSGCGSEERYAAEFAKQLGRCLRELGARRLFDAPCGDLNWILDVIRNEEVEYLGGDISSTLIAELRSTYPQLQLRLFDICSDRFPNADVWLCRDCLFHLPFSDIRQALANFAQSDIPYALLTTHAARLLRNLDVPAGGFRYLDLERPPIDLPPALRYLKDFRRGRDFPRYVGLWPREAVAEAVGQWPIDPST